MTKAIATIPLKRAEHVYALRQGGRVASQLLGNDDADQVRFATALSELGREALSHGSQTVAEFSMATPSLLQISFKGFPREALRPQSGLDAARKLLDEVRVVDDGSPTLMVMVTRAAGLRAPAVDPAAMRKAVVGVAAAEPLDELRLKNEDLINALGQLRERKDELERLNAELEETNRGVMAMYSQLAGELEETNRGVVALYAELDDKSARLNEANQAKSRFLASVSHELRSPVNSIIGLLGLLTDAQSEPLSGDQSKQLSLVDGSARELLALVNSLLDLAKAESGRLQPEPARFALSDVFSELRGSHRPLLRDGVTLNVDAASGISVESDRMLLTQVLRNLITNAVKFTAQGSITVTATLPEPYELSIAVTDTGIGIAPENQERVFEEFFQVRGSLQSRHKGSGLGLPYARRVAEALGGSLTLQSEPGAGSTFTLSLPLHWQPQVAQSTGAVSGEHAVRLATALIIDDDEGFRMALRGLLQGIAERVFEAPGGYSGLEAMRKETPQIVFVDLRMPDLDGAEVLAEMNADPALRSIPAIIITSTELTAPTRQTLGHAKALLSKEQVNQEKLRDAVASALGETEGKHG